MIIIWVVVTHCLRSINVMERNHKEHGEKKAKTKTGGEDEAEMKSEIRPKTDNRKNR